MKFTRREIIGAAGGLVSMGASRAQAQDARILDPIIDAARKEGGVVLSTGLESAQGKRSSLFFRNAV